MLRRLLLAPLVVAALALMPGRATGVDRFDLIIFNHDQVQTCANLGGDFAIVHEGGMLVNTGTQPITKPVKLVFV